VKFTALTRSGHSQLASSKLPLSIRSEAARQLGSCSSCSSCPSCLSSTCRAAASLFVLCRAVIQPCLCSDCHCQPSWPLVISYRILPRHRLQTLCHPAYSRGAEGLQSLRGPRESFMYVPICPSPSPICLWCRCGHDGLSGCLNQALTVSDTYPRRPRST